MTQIDVFSSNLFQGIHTVSVGAPPIVVHLGLAAIGVMFAVIAIALIVRFDLDLVKSSLTLVSSFVGSSATVAGARQLLDFRQVDLGVGDAMAFAVLGFSGTLFLAFIVIPGLVAAFLLAMLLYRVGPACTVHAFQELAVGRERIEAAGVFWRRFKADRIWDQFTVAVAKLVRELEISGVSTAIPSSAGISDDLTDEQIRQLLDSGIGSALKEFNSETSHSAWRFSIWRIAKSNDELERVWISGDYPNGGTIPLWETGNPEPKCASVAAKAMFARTHVSVRTGQLDLQMPTGGMGRSYDAFRCEPLTVENVDWPWGILCIDRLEGSLPIHSRSIGTIARRLSKAVRPLGPAICKRHLGDTLPRSPNRG